MSHTIQRNTKNTIISEEFGLFPELDEKHRSDFPSGKIVLKYGMHKRVNKGFGFIHILKEHASELTKYNLQHSEDGVIKYIQLILRSGAKIHSEFASVGKPHRPMVVLSSVGTVVLEQDKINGKIVYSVVTAFGRKYAKGCLIGIF